MYTNRHGFRRSSMAGLIGIPILSNRSIAILGSIGTSYYYIAKLGAKCSFLTE